MEVAKSDLFDNSIVEYKEPLPTELENAERIANLLRNNNLFNNHFKFNKEILAANTYSIENIPFKSKAAERSLESLKSKIQGKPGHYYFKTKLEASTVNNTSLSKSREGSIHPRPSFLEKGSRRSISVQKESKIEPNVDLNKGLKNGCNSGLEKLKKEKRSFVPLLDEMMKDPVVLSKAKDIIEQEDKVKAFIKTVSLGVNQLVLKKSTSIDTLAMVSSTRKKLRAKKQVKESNFKLKATRSKMISELSPKNSSHGSETPGDFQAKVMVKKANKSKSLDYISYKLKDSKQNLSIHLKAVHQNKKALQGIISKEIDEEEKRDYFFSKYVKMSITNKRPSNLVSKPSQEDTESKSQIVMQNIRANSTTITQEGFNSPCSHFSSTIVHYLDIDRIVKSFQDSPNYFSSVAMTMARRTTARVMISNPTLGPTS